MFLIVVKHDMKEWFVNIARCIDKWLQSPFITQHVDPAIVSHEVIPAVRAVQLVSGRYIILQIKHKVDWELTHQLNQTQINKDDIREKIKIVDHD